MESIIKFLKFSVSVYLLLHSSMLVLPAHNSIATKVVRTIKKFLSVILNFTDFRVYYTRHFLPYNLRYLTNRNNNVLTTILIWLIFSFYFERRFTITNFQNHVNIFSNYFAEYFSISKNMPYKKKNNEYPHIELFLPAQQKMQ